MSSSASKESTTLSQIEKEEPDKASIQKKLKENVLTIFKQIKNGCERKFCYNIYCNKNFTCRESNLIYLIFIYLNYRI